MKETKVSPVIIIIFLMLAALVVVSSENLTSKLPILNWIGAIVGLGGLVILIILLSKEWIARRKK